MDSSGGSAPVKGRPEECMEDQRAEPANLVRGIHRKALIGWSVMQDAEIEIQDLRSQLAKERRTNQELESMAERAEHHSEMASTISALMRAVK
eukprot:1373205-Amphidinium_carterae.2